MIHSLFGKLKQTLSKKQQVNIIANSTYGSVIEEADPQSKCFYKFGLENESLETSTSAESREPKFHVSS